MTAQWNGWLLAIVGGIVLVAIAAAVLLWWRRRRTDSMQGAAGEPAAKAREGRPHRPLSLPERAVPLRPSESPEHALPSRVEVDTEPHGAAQPFQAFGDTLPLGARLPEALAHRASGLNTEVWLEADEPAIVIRGDGKASFVANVCALEWVDGTPTDATHDVRVVRSEADSRQILMRHAPGWHSFSVRCHRYGSPLLAQILVEGLSKRGLVVRPLTFSVRVEPITVELQIEARSHGFRQTQIVFGLPMHCARIRVRLSFRDTAKLDSVTPAVAECVGKMRVDGGQWSRASSARSGSDGAVVFALPELFLRHHGIAMPVYELPQPIELSLIDDTLSAQPPAAAPAVQGGIDATQPLSASNLRAQENRTPVLAQNRDAHEQALDIAAFASDLDALCEFAAAPDVGAAALEYAQWMLQAIATAPTTDLAIADAQNNWRAVRVEGAERLEIACWRITPTPAQLRGACAREEWTSLVLQAGAQCWSTQENQPSAKQALTDVPRQSMRLASDTANSTGVNPVSRSAVLLLPDDYQVWLAREPANARFVGIENPDAPTQAILLTFAPEHQAAVVKAAVRFRERAGQLPNGLALAIEQVAQLPAVILERAPKHLAMEWREQMMAIDATSELRGLE